ncbi:MAG: hypothetical protein HKN42_17315 [Granulosicoccus sp.]|nr:hypothetical protein [Granulosicoccus sp.]
MIAYVVAHWRGQHSLARSFWLNLVLIRVLIFGAQNVLDPGDGLDYSLHALPVVSATVLVHGLLLLWQLVGVVRAAESDFATRGNLGLVWAVQLGAVLMFLLSAVYALGALQWIIESPVEEDPLARMAREHASRYQLTVSPSGTELALDGSIESGITSAVRQLLHQNPLISQVKLASPGGNVYEARGLAQLFREHQLSTRVEGICSSACTTAFAGGSHRSASPDAALGFHQYRFDASYTIIATDVQTEQQRDADLFRNSGVSDWFINSLFQRPPGDMWWPGLDDLLRANMIHEVRP